MASRSGICKNYANCDSADKDTVFEIEDGDEFICPDCKKLLQDSNPESGGGTEFKGPGKKRPWIGYSMVGGIALTLFFVVGALNKWIQGNPRIQLSTTAVTFQFQQMTKGVGIQEIEIQNVGESGDLDISKIHSTDPDFTTRKKEYVIKPGKSVKLEILFTPTVSGQHDATLTLVSDDQSQPEVKVQLSGTAGKLGPWWIWEQQEQSSKVFQNDT